MFTHHNRQGLTKVNTITLPPNGTWEREMSRKYRSTASKANRLAIDTLSQNMPSTSANRLLRLCSTGQPTVDVSLRSQPIRKALWHVMPSIIRDAAIPVHATANTVNPCMNRIDFNRAFKTLYKQVFTRASPSI